MVINFTVQTLRAVPILVIRTILLTIVAVGALVQTVPGQTSLPNASAVDEAMRRAHDYWIAHNGLGNSGWARGAYNTGNQRAFRVLGERAYHNRAVNWGDANQWKIGPEGTGSADAWAHTSFYILQGILQNASLLFHPIEQRRNGPEVVIGVLAASLCRPHSSHRLRQRDVDAVRLVRLRRVQVGNRDLLTIGHGTRVAGQLRPNAAD